MANKFNPFTGNFDVVLDKASEITYDDATTGLGATNVQTAIQALDTGVDNRALRDLSNLTTTAINANLTYAGTTFWTVVTANQTTIASTGVAFGSGTAVNLASGNTSLRSGAVSGTGNSGTATLSSGTTTSGNSGQINIITGNSSAGGATGQIAMFSGTTTGATTSGQYSISTGTNTGTGNSGNGFVRTGALNNVGTTGTVNVGSGNQTGSGNSGSVSITTGSATTGSTGNLTLQTGTTAGVRGAIRLQNGTEGTAGYLWTSTDTLGTGQWTAPSFVPSANVGIAGGVAGLDGAGKVPLTQLPSSLMTYEGLWNPSTNSPTLVDGTGDIGSVYRVSAVAAGPIAGLNDSTMVNFKVGDWVAYDGSVWQKSAMTDSVASVNGFQGIVVLTTTDIAEGTNEYFTPTKAQNAITGGASSIVTTNLTASRALVANSSGKVAVSTVTDTELSYLSGVSSAIQTQLNAKQATITGAATTIASANLTASRAVISDASGKVAVSSVTDTELGYLSGTTSAVQTQINSKQTKLSTAAVNSNITLNNNTVALVDTSAARTLTLPAASADAQIVVKDATGSAETNTITLNTTAGALIDGAASVTITSNYGSLAVISNGTNWFVL